MKCFVNVNIQKVCTCELHGKWTLKLGMELELLEAVVL